MMHHGADVLRPLQPHGPRYDLKHHARAAQHDDGRNVGVTPFVAGVENVEALKHVDEDEDDGGVAHSMVRHIPIWPDRVLLIRPPDHSEHLVIPRSNKKDGLDGERHGRCR